MANPLNMMKQVREVRKIQKQLAKKVVEARSPDGTIVVQAKADMTIKKIDINIDDLSTRQPERLAKVITSTVNSALESCRKAAAEDMQKLARGTGLGDLLGM